MGHWCFVNVIKHPPLALYKCYKFLLYMKSRNAKKRSFWHFEMCTQQRDSDQTAHSRSLIRIFTVRIRIDKGAKFLHADNEDSEQAARMRRLIWVFVGRTWQKVHFLILRIKLTFLLEKYIRKTRLFIYMENFSSKSWIFSDKEKKKNK